MGFTAYGGDPQWLRDQRASARRATAPMRRAMPYPSQTPQHQPRVVEASPEQFVQGAKSNSGVAFVLGALVGVAVTRARR